MTAREERAVTAVDVAVGTGTFADANTLVVAGGEGVTFKSAIIATGRSRSGLRSTGSTPTAVSTPRACSLRPRFPTA